MGQSTIKTYARIFHTVGGITEVVEQAESPVSVTGQNATQGRIEKKKVRFAAAGDSAGGDKVLLWDGTAAGAIRDFSKLSVDVRTAGGRLALNWLTDTYDGNGAPTGSQPNGLPDTVKYGSIRICNDNTLSDSTTDATSRGVTGGVPDLQSASLTTVKRFKLYGRNLGAEPVDCVVAVMD